MTTTHHERHAMTRPSTHLDLTEDSRRGRQVAQFELQYLPMNGKLLSALGAFITAAEGAKMTTTNQYGTTYVYRTPTTAELDEALADAQGTWDKNRRNYEAALISGTEPEDYTRWGIKSWCEAEGVALPWLNYAEAS